MAAATRLLRLQRHALLPRRVNTGDLVLGDPADPVLCATRGSGAGSARSWDPTCRRGRSGCRSASADRPRAGRVSAPPRARRQTRMSWRSSVKARIIVVPWRISLPSRVNPPGKTDQAGLPARWCGASPGASTKTKWTLEKSTSASTRPGRLVEERPRAVAAVAQACVRRRGPLTSCANPARSARRPRKRRTSTPQSDRGRLWSWSRAAPHPEWLPHPGNRPRSRPPAQRHPSASRRPRSLGPRGTAGSRRQPRSAPRRKALRQHAW